MDSERTIELAAERTGLIIVDMQSGRLRKARTGAQTGGSKTFALYWTVFAKGRRQDHPHTNRSGRRIIPSLLSASPYSLLDDSPAVEFIDELKPDPSEIVVKKYSHDCFYQTTLEDRLKELDLRPCRDHVVVTGIGSNNCVYHAVIGFHIRNYIIHVPEDCIHASQAEGQQFALSQFRSPAYNYNVGVTTIGKHQAFVGHGSSGGQSLRSASNRIVSSFSALD